ncbi:MAG: type II secretion system inner membrane protein GspF [Maricaulaceae bacterium]
METFDYVAIDRMGQRLSGSVAATTPREARDILRGRALRPIDVNAAKTKSTSSRLFEKKTSLKDVTQTTRQLAILIDASTPIEEALKITALQFERSPMRQVLLDTRARVLEGERLSDAMQAYPKTFPPLYTAMIASGETSGRLPSVLERLAQDMEAAQAVRRKILAATVYPMVLSVVALGVITILMVFVVPKVVEQFDSFGQDLPMLTKAVIAFSGWLKAYGLIAAATFVFAVIGFRYALTKDTVKLRWHNFILGLPLIGRLSRNLNAARFARTVSGLIESGTPSLAAMETARHTLKNKVMNQAVAKANIKIREGASISSALKQTEVFPALVTQLVAGGEAGGNVALMFSKSADYLEGEFESATNIFMSLLEPLIIILLSLVVLLIIGAIFLPILRLNTLAF